MAEANHSLEAYQSDILNRLEQAKGEGATNAANHLGVLIAGKPVLLNMTHIAETLPLVDITPVPLVQSWFLGLANVRGVLYGMNDLGALLFGQGIQLSSSSRVILLTDKVKPHIGIVVDQLLGLRNVNAMQVMDAVQTSEIDINLAQHQDAEQTWGVLDLEKLVNAHAFMVPEEASSSPI